MRWFVTHKLLDCNEIIVIHKLLHCNEIIVTHKLLHCNEMIVTHKLLDCNEMIVTHKLLDCNEISVTHKLLDCNEIMLVVVSYLEQLIQKLKGFGGPFATFGSMRLCHRANSGGNSRKRVLSMCNELVSFSLFFATFSNFVDILWSLKFFYFSLPVNRKCSLRCKEIHPV